MGRKAKSFFYESKGKCPWCEKNIEIKVRKIQTVKPTKAEYEFKQIMEKDSQTELPRK